MSYLTYALLTEDVDFGRRSRSCIFQQATYFLKDDSQTAQVHAMCGALLKSEPAPTVGMLQAIAAGPNFDVEVDNGDGTIDSSKVQDEEILSQCQAMLPEIAALYFDDTGAPIT